MARRRIRARSEDPAERRRTWPQRLLIAANALALVAAAATAGTLAYSNRKVSDIGRVDLSSVTAAGEVDPGDPMNFLVVGIDDAAGLADGDSVRTGRVDGSLQTDTIMVVRIDPRKQSVDVLSFPRDLYVPISGLDSDQRLNAALATGGAVRLIETIGEDFGIPIHHYVQVDFAGFRQIVEIIDGVPVHFPRPARSAKAGLVIEEPGCYALGPVQALGFTRARSDYQVQDSSGDWHTDPRSDFSRVERQQMFIQLALRQAIVKGIRNPDTLRRLVDQGVAIVSFDDALDVQTLVDLGIRFRNFSPEQIVTHTLPVIDDVVGAAEVLRLIEDQAEPILALFQGVDPGEVAAARPGDVTVQVLNGTGERGQGGEASDGLGDLGFLTTGTADADTTGGPTTVRYLPGGESAARAVARAVQGPVVYERADGLGGADAVLVTGSDWAGVAVALRSLDEVPGPVADGGATSTDPAAPDTGPVDPGTTDPGVTDPGVGEPSVTDTTVPAAPVMTDDPRQPEFFLASPPQPGDSCEGTG